MKSYFKTVCLSSLGNGKGCVVAFYKLLCQNISFKKKISHQTPHRNLSLPTLLLGVSHCTHNADPCGNQTFHFSECYGSHLLNSVFFRCLCRTPGHLQRQFLNMTHSAYFPESSDSSSGLTELEAEAAALSKPWVPGQRPLLPSVTSRTPSLKITVLPELCAMTLSVCAKRAHIYV